MTSLGADISATAGSYQIVASDAVGTGIENYDISYINGNLLVNSLPNATISQSTIKCLDDNASITFTGSNGAQGTSGVWYKFYYRIDDNPTELSITSVKDVYKRQVLLQEELLIPTITTLAMLSETSLLIQGHLPNYKYYYLVKLPLQELEAEKQVLQQGKLQ